MKVIRQKNSVGDLWSVGESVSNNFIDGYTDGQSTPKKNFTLFILSVLPSLNITYHQ
jgi:hypothetical protein